MIAGETILTGAPQTCAECEVDLEMQVLQSGGGYYVGTQCMCGPNTRETLYFASHLSAEAALVKYLAGHPMPQARTT